MGTRDLLQMAVPRGTHLGIGNERLLLESEMAASLSKSSVEEVPPSAIQPNDSWGRDDAPISFPGNAVLGAQDGSH